MICSKCKENKSIDEFYIRSDSGIPRGECKLCSKLYREENKLRHKELNHQYYLNNKNKIVENVYNYRNNNRIKFLEYSKNYYLNNKEKIVKMCSENFSYRWKNSIEMQLHSNVSNAIRKQIKKENNTFSMLPYNIKELKAYLKTTIKEFSWDDYSGDKYHIDHIIPKSLYTFTSYKDDDFQKCWNLRNLRLTPVIVNLSKSNTLDYNLIEKYKIYDLLPDKIINENKSLRSKEFNKNILKS